MRKISFIFIFLTSISLFAQEDETPPKLTVGMYLDLFYGYDFNQPDTEQRLPYLYHHNRHASFNMNHGVLFARLENDRFRSNIAFQSGSYVADNYADEPDIYKTIFNANIGVALNSKKNIWLDAGIFGDSYIGFESTWNHDNINVGHNLISENVPYFMTGIKATYLYNDNWTATILMLNGWQRIKMVEGGSMPSFGTQLNYKKNKYKINWSTFIGTNDPDDFRRMRYFHNFYGLVNLNVRWAFQLGFDVGLQQTSKGSSTYNSWYGTAIIARYRMNEKWRFGGRFEYYSDPNEVIVSTNQGGYKTNGFSLNSDYQILKDLKWRVEARYFASPDFIYPTSSGNRAYNFFILTTLSFLFETKPIGL